MLVIRHGSDGTKWSTWAKLAADSSDSCSDANALSERSSDCKSIFTPLSR